MAFQISPGVNVTEIDLTTVVPRVATTDGGLVGDFRWGPIEDVTLVSSEDNLVKLFGKPDTDNAAVWFTASSFLSYGDKLRLVRCSRAGQRVAAHEDSIESLMRPIVYGVTIENEMDETDPLNPVPTGNSLITKAHIPDNSDPDIGLTAVLGSVITVVGGANDGEEAIVIALYDDNTTQILVGPRTDDGAPTNTTPMTEDTSADISIYNPLSFPQFYNDVDFNEMLVENEFSTLANKTITCAKYAGQKGSSLKVAICPSSRAFSHQATVTIDQPLGYDSNKFRLTLPVDEIKLLAYGTIVEDRLGNTATIIELVDATHVNVVLDDVANPLYTDALNHSLLTFSWAYKNIFGLAPNTSDYVALHGGQNDEMHIVVVDENGLFTGLPGQILEKFQYVSKSVGAKTQDGATNYWINVLNSSAYVRALTNPGDAYHHSSSGTNLAVDFDFGGSNSTVYSNNVPPIVESYTAGNDGEGYITNASYVKGYDLFRNSETIDMSLVMLGDAPIGVAQYVINNVCEYRKDCIALLSPDRTDVIYNSSPTEATILTRYALGLSSSYGVMDSGWKYTYDKYNDAYRWCPLNGDIAGLCVRTDIERQPWFSPAGFNRGNIKNCIKLATNPDKAHRDDLYTNGINPVVTFPAQGTVLYGDKTLLSKPSAFDRINVRRLFIVLEKAISIAAKYSLFELNDAFTRAQFRALVEPYLRDVKAGRGIYDFKVVCDESNNTPEVIDHNEFVGDIYIKPARSINFIQLNFIAVRTGVAFEEIVGKF